MATNNYHTPVLLSEVTKGLNLRKGKKYIDATLGGGGHALEILRNKGLVLGIDCDPEALEEVREKVKSLDGESLNNLILVKENFAHLKKIAERHHFNKVAGILFDLGLSSHQLETPGRGFSFDSEAALDMRMDPQLSVTAKDLINGLTEGELYELFKKYAEEDDSWRIARALVRARTLKPITTCDELADIVVKAKGRDKFERIHPATRVFQALRMVVNDELNNLKGALPQAVDLLENGGRLVVLSFHSLEDRIVKNFFKEQEEQGVLKILTKKPIEPTDAERKRNHRSRSAKLRIAEKYE